MSRFTGQSGTVTYSTHSGLSVQDWKADTEAADINTTSTGDNNTYVGITGPTKCSGTFKMFLDSSTAPTLQSAVLAGGQATLTLIIGSTTKTITGTANVLKASIDNPAEEGVTFEVGFVYTAGFTIGA